MARAMPSSTSPRRLPPDLPVGVLSHPELASAGVTRTMRRRMLRSGRWVAIGPGKGVVTHTGSLHGADASRSALLMVGPSARLGGMSALIEDGLKGYDEPLTHIWVPKGCEKSTRGLPDAVRLHETRRWVADDSVTVGVPRSRPDVATVQAALWAVSARQAALCLVMPIQQRMVRADDVAVQLDRIARHEFRTMLRAVLADIRLGAESLNELDFAHECRARGIPEPTRQSRRKLSSGSVVLDVFWDKFGVCVEVNGAGHDALGVSMRDELRLADLQTQGDAALPLSVLTLRADPGPFFEALKRLLRSRGWTG